MKSQTFTPQMSRTMTGFGVLVSTPIRYALAREINKACRDLPIEELSRRIGSTKSVAARIKRQCRGIAPTIKFDRLMWVALRLNLEVECTLNVKPSLDRSVPNGEIGKLSKRRCETRKTSLQDVREPSSSDPPGTDDSTVSVRS